MRKLSMLELSMISSLHCNGKSTKNKKIIAYSELDTRIWYDGERKMKKHDDVLVHDEVQGAFGCPLQQLRSR